MTNDELLQQVKDLKEENTSLKIALKSSGIAYWDWNPKTNVVTFDKEWFEQINVLDKDSSKLDSWMDALHPDDTEMVGQKIQDHLDCKTEVYEASMRLRDKNGKYRHVLAKGKIIQRDEQGTPTRFSGVHVDLTEMMELRESCESQKAVLVQNSKLSSLGEMAGGIAHEINTPLTIIRGYAEISAMLDLKTDEGTKELYRNLTCIEDTTDRINKIIKGLQQFSKSGDSDKIESVTLDNFLKETLSFIGPKLAKYNIRFNINCPSDLNIDIKKIQIAQVFVGLINNAKDAIKDTCSKWIKIDIEELKDDLKISVTDSGTGIPTNIEHKIFNPFFTTKAVGEGTGLGLSISKGIIESHNGVIYLDKKSPNTKFIIELPKVQKGLE